MGWEDRFKSSRWFHRGWTLQELIAPQPKCRYFYDKHWRRIDAPYGPITVEHINHLIHSKTGIPLGILDGSQPLEEINIASKMRWAANRSTSREEDVAYSLMGLFGIQMTLQYGEGKEKAFTRLQKKILKQTGDQSMFAWADPRQSLRLGLLAPFPECFEVPDVDHDNMDVHQLGPAHDISTWAITNQGLRLTLHVVDIGQEPRVKLCAYLGIMDKKERKLPTLELYQLGGNRYQRGPGLEFRDPPEHSKTEKLDLVVAFTTTGPRTKTTPPISVLLPPSTISDGFSVQLDGHFDCKWAPGPDADSRPQMVCRYPVEEGGFHVASAKISVSSPTKPSEEEARQDGGAVRAPANQDKEDFYLHCWLDWVAQSDLKWSVVCQLSDKESRNRPPRNTKPAQSPATGMVTSKKGYMIRIDHWRMYAFGTESISISLAFVSASNGGDNVASASPQANGKLLHCPRSTLGIGIHGSVGSLVFPVSFAMSQKN